METTHSEAWPTPDEQGERAAPPSSYSITQAADLLGVSRVTVWRWIRAGRIPVGRLGHRTTRIGRDDLERLLLERVRAQLGPTTSPSWVGQQLASDDRPAPRADGNGSTGSEHRVQFYETDASLVEAMVAFLAPALRAGDAGLVIATPEHREALEIRLQGTGLNLAAARASGAYVTLDAAETLDRFMMDGMPDRQQFVEVMGGIIAQAAATGRSVRAFGEMVALLVSEGNQPAALHLEGLWNELQATRAFSLFCAYPLADLGGAPQADLLDGVCALHTHVVPAESYTALPSPDDRLRAIALLQQKATWLEVEIAERRRAEAALRQREAELADFFDNAAVGLHWVGPDGIIQRVNQAELDLLGYTREEYVGRHIAEFHVDAEVIKEILARLTCGETLRDVEARLRCKDGSIKHVLITSNGRWQDGEFIHSRCFTRDITDRRQADEVRQRLAAIVESSEDAIIGKTLDAVITSWNGAAERMYGYSPEEAVGQSIAMLVPSDRPDELPTIMARLRRGERIAHYETERVRKDGTRLAVALTISPIRDATGTLIGASTIARDITSRKRTEAALRASEQRYRRIFDTAAVSLWEEDFSAAIALLDELRAAGVTDLRAHLDAHPDVLARALQLVRIVDVNAQTLRLFDAPSKAELLASLETIFVPETLPVFRDELVSIFEGRPTFESEAPVQTVRGERREVVFTMALPESGAVHGPVLVSLMDITARKRTEAALREQVEIVETVSRVGSALSAELDLETLVQAVTDAATELSGAQFGAFFYNAADERGEHYTLYTLSGASREAFARFPLPRNTALFGPTFRGECVVRLADVTADPRYDANAPYHGTPAGHLPVRSYLAVPVISRTGTVLGGLFLGHPEPDVFSEHAERIVTGLAAQAAVAMDNARLYQESQAQTATHVALNAALREAMEARDQALAETQAALGVRDDFLGAISHDLRTPLSSIKGLTQLLMRQASRSATLESAQLTPMLTTVDAATGKMATMIDELLDVTRVNAGQTLELDRQPTDLVTLVQAAVAECQRSVHEHRVVIVTELAALLGQWDAARLDRVVVNLLSNAVKYSPQGGTITVSFSAEATDAGAWATLTVQDEGVGIPAADLPQIFERFHRGANVTGQIRGVGIGLAGCKQIVELHGGSIAIASEEGAGTTVTLRLPCDATAAVEPAAGFQP